MSKPARQLLFLLAAAATAGCSHPLSHSSDKALPTSHVSASQPTDEKAFVPLTQLTPALQLPAPATQPTTRPSADALVMYAAARDAEVRGQHFVAIGDLERASLVDPYSYAIQYDLARDYIAANMNEQAARAFEQAARIEPNHLDLQVALGRLYLSRGKLDDGIKHLRLAKLTSEYQEDDGQAAVGEFFLARALKEAGYDRAALDQYDQLLNRFKNPSMTIRRNAELAYLIARPELMYSQIGELYERHEEYADALRAYQLAADGDGENQDMQFRIARMLASTGDREGSLRTTANIIVKNHANADSLALLNDVCRRLGLNTGQVDSLQQLHDTHPGDNAILFALIDTLNSQKQNDRAETVLRKSWEQSPADVQIVRRLVAVDEKRGDSEGAARVLVIALAKDPDILRNLSPLWSGIVRPGNHARINLAKLQEMKFPAEVEPAKDFWVSKIADLDHRDALSKSAMQKAVAGIPPFAPAYRAELLGVWGQDDLSDDQKIEASNKLIAGAEAGHDPALAEELRGLSLLNQKKPVQAGEALGRAIKLDDRSPDRLLSYALAIHQPGKDAAFEQALQKLVNDHPLYEEGYSSLFRYYTTDANDLNSGLKVLSTWIAADPQSVAARVVQTSVQAQLGQVTEAETALWKLFDEMPDNADVLGGIQQFYTRFGKYETAIEKLNAYRSKHPDDTDVVSRLASIYAQHDRMKDAKRVIDETRTAVSSDADLLYVVAQLYAQLNERATSEEVLQQVVKLNAAHAGASNDLGFSWADEGKNLPQAESLIRTAVSVEPDNQSFLDSLGWVLYKRGKFGEARKYLEEAIGPAAFPDPVVLDHLGDTLYRLSLVNEASKLWQRSLRGIGEEDASRDDLKKLQIHLREKLKAAESKRPVQVAPVVVSSTS